MNQFIAYKKSIQICIGFLFLIQYPIAQSNLAYTQQLFQNKDLSRARESIDSFVMLNKNDAEGWITKAAIYNSINKDPVAGTLVADAKMEAFQALKKAMALNKPAADSQINPRYYNIALDLYNSYTSEGLHLYNSGVDQNNSSNYNEALLNFKNAGSIGRFMYENKWGMSELDTLNLYYTTKAAINADKEVDAEFYSKLIIDKNITYYQQQRGFENIYQWLAYFYKIKADSFNFNYYNLKGLNAFPASDYFSLLYLDWYRQAKDYHNLFKQYEVILNKNISNDKYRLAYYQDLYNYTYEKKGAPAERKLYQSRLFKGLKAYLQQKPGNPNPAANLLMGKYYINQAAEIAREMAMRSTTDKLIMNEYKSRIAGNFKKSNSYLLTIINIKRLTPKKNYAEALQLLISNFRLLNMPKEVRKHQVILTSVSITLFNLLILILLLLNIILIIGFFHSFVILMMSFFFKKWFGLSCRCAVWPYCGIGISLSSRYLPDSTQYLLKMIGFANMCYTACIPELFRRLT